QLLKKLESVDLDLKSKIEPKALNAGGEYLRDKLKENVPVRTSNWKDNIIVSPPVYSVSAGTQVDVGADQQGDAFYGYFYEFGTSKQQAQPVYGPTLENNKSEVQGKISTVIKEGLGL
ncbi:TPA: HK97-gp10 family putative phage morphogenesis protein, partial [Escherichia coli]